VDYVNISQSIATVISSRLATLHELGTTLGTQDMWDLLEINAIDQHNTYIMNRD